MTKAQLKVAEQRKARGAFFTPPDISRFMTAWAVRSAEDKVLEPSCGEASFLLPAAQRLRGDADALRAGTRHGRAEIFGQQIGVGVGERQHAAGKGGLIVLVVAWHCALFLISPAVCAIVFGNA